MTERSQDPRRLDMRALAADAATVTGAQAAVDLPRFQQSVLVPEPPHCGAAVLWSATGSMLAVVGAPDEVWMHLQAATEVTLICQRCLQPMTDALHVDRHYQFVASESEAERLDDISDDEVLVLAKSIDVFDLLEDELILALPIVPRHGTCPQPLVAGGIDAFGADEDDTPHPFAALASLRKPPLAS